MRPIDPRRRGRAISPPHGVPVIDRETLKRTAAALAAQALKASTPKPPTEHDGIAVPLAVWVRSHEHTYPDLLNFTAIPHAEQSKRQAGRKWAEGVRAGYPDCLLDVARGGWHGLRLELKRPCHWPDGRATPLKAGEPSAAQVDWHHRLAHRGYIVSVCWRWESARDVLVWYMKLPYTGHERHLPDVPGFAYTRTHFL